MNRLTRAPVRTGYRITNHEPATATTSSASDRSMFENGSGVALTSTRTPAFVAGVEKATLPARSTAATSTTGSAWPSAAVAVTAAPSGRMKVWIASHAVSTQG